MDFQKLPVKSRSELAEEYGVSRRTFYKLLKKHGINLSKGLITPLDQVLIYNRLGTPVFSNQEKDKNAM